MAAAAAAVRPSSASIKPVPASKLFVSQPQPAMFGNPANQPDAPGWTNPNWLKSRFHFSFAEYNSPHNQQFGVLRVMNDDLVQPSRGFGAHPHRDMEICTYVVRGELSHQDSMGTSETLGPGAIQFMTAGTGVRHSEHNLSAEHDLRFIQMWLLPRKRGLSPNYGSTPGRREVDGWQHLVSDVAAGVDTPVQINTDANIFVARVKPGETAELRLAAGRQGYLLLVEGQGIVDLAGARAELEQHDAAELRGHGTLAVLAGEAGAHVLLVEMAAAGDGRADL